MATSSIGTAARAYSTPAAWETDKAGDLVTAAEGERGETYDDSDFTAGFNVSGGWTTDATFFAELRAASGEEYDIRDGTGSLFLISSSAGGTRVAQAQQAWTRFASFGIEITGGDSDTVGVYMNSVGHFCEQVVVIDRTVDRSAETAKALFFVAQSFSEAQRNFFRNCKAVGGGTNVLGGQIGFHTGASGDFTSYQNCIAIDIFGDTGTGEGFVLADSNSDCRNCIALDCALEDFNDTAGGSIDYCTSSDTTAVGANSNTSETAANVFENSGSDDFRLKAGSVAIDDGLDLSGDFSQSYEPGVNHADASGSWNQGAYDGFVSAGGNATNQGTLAALIQQDEMGLLLRS